MAEEETGQTEIALTAFSVKKNVCFAIYGFILVAVLFLGSRFAPVMPAWSIAVSFALLSALSAIGVAYHAVIHKTVKQHMLVEGGSFSNYNEGRLIRFLVAFILSAITTFGLILEMPNWHWSEWAILIAGIPIFMIVAWLMRCRLDKEYEPAYLQSRVVIWSSVCVAAILCILYLISLWLTPVPSLEGASLREALATVPSPYETAHSPLLLEADFLNSFIEATKNFAVSAAAEYFSWMFYVAKFLLGASALISYSSMLGTLYLGFGELSRACKTLESVKHPTEPARCKPKHVLLTIVLTLALGCGYYVADWEAGKSMEDGTLASFNTFIKENSEVVAVFIDGKYYNAVTLVNLTFQTLSDTASLNQLAKDKLPELINAMCDEQIEKVDSLVKLYYEGEANRELGEYAAGQLKEMLVDTSGYQELTKYLEDYSKNAAQIQDDFNKGLSECEIPEYLNPLVIDESGYFTKTLKESLAACQSSLDTEAQKIDEILNKKPDDGPFSFVNALVHKFLVWINKSQYEEEMRQQLIDAINQSRQEMLSQVEEL